MKDLFLASYFRAIYNHVLYRNLIFVMALSQKAIDKRVLDVGAGDCQYRKHFTSSDYTTQDVCDKDVNFSYKHIDIKSEIYTIPLPDNNFDYILCTQVLEHLKYPAKALTELNRLLKHNGELWLTVPLTWEEHEIPYDYFRYTRYSLKFLAEETGYKVQSIKPQGGRFIVLGKMIKDLVPGLTRNYYLYIIMALLQMPITFPILTILFYFDFLDKRKELTLQYECVFVKS